jgi:hypothetical protein
MVSLGAGEVPEVNALSYLPENGGRLSYTYLHPMLEAGEEPGEVREKSWQLINLFPVKLMI